MTKNNRTMALVLAIVLFFVMLFSTFFVAESLHHECIGDACPICQAISVCQSSIKLIAYIVFAVIIAGLLYSQANALPILITKIAGVYSLVSLKVKLSN